MPSAAATLLSAEPIADDSAPATVVLTRSSSLVLSSGTAGPAPGSAVAEPEPARPCRRSGPSSWVPRGPPPRESGLRRRPREGCGPAAAGPGRRRGPAHPRRSPGPRPGPRWCRRARTRVRVAGGRRLRRAIRLRRALGLVLRRGLPRVLGDHPRHRLRRRRGGRRPGLALLAAAVTLAVGSDFAAACAALRLAGYGRRSASQDPGHRRVARRGLQPRDARRALRGRQRGERAGRHRREARQRRRKTSDGGGRRDGVLPERLAPARCFARACRGPQGRVPSTVRPPGPLQGKPPRTFRASPLDCRTMKPPYEPPSPTSSARPMSPTEV